MSEPEKVLALIRDAEVWRLGNFDGCICSSFSVRNVDVDISCGKGSPRGVCVSSPSLDYYGEGAVEALTAIAQEVVRQVEGVHDGRGPIPITVREAA